MDMQAWGIVVGVAMTAILALAPWMFMMHAKLAVIAAQVAEMGEKIERAIESYQELWQRSADHETRIALLEAQEE